MKFEDKRGDCCESDVVARQAGYSRITPGRLSPVLLLMYRGVFVCYTSHHGGDKSPVGRTVDGEVTGCMGMGGYTVVRVLLLHGIDMWD